MYPQWPYSYPYPPVQNGGQMNDDVYSYIQELMKRIHQLEERQKQLQEKIEAIKPLTIENINYKIQDLHVQELSGNLLVGLTALSDAEELQELLREQNITTVNPTEISPDNERHES